MSTSEKTFSGRLQRKTLSVREKNKIGRLQEKQS